MTHRWMCRVLIGLSLTYCLAEGQFDCLKGWLLKNEKCYQEGTFETEFEYAITACENKGGKLWLPEARNENNAFYDRRRGYWIGLYHENNQWRTADNKTWNVSTAFNEFDSSDLRNLPTSKQCVRRNGLIMWYLTDCTERKKFGCERPPICSYGWFGRNCTQRCHCAYGTCNNITGMCIGLCERGWGGPTCSTEKTKVEATYYCLNTQRGPEMIFRADLNNVTYRVKTAVDREGNPVTCDELSTEQDLTSVTIKKNGTAFVPGCGAETIDSQTTTWRFRFNQFPGITMRTDVTFIVTCNFSNAETLEVSSALGTQIGRQAIDYIPPSHLDVVMKVTEPGRDLPISEVTMGQSVQLKLEFHPDNAYTVKVIAPYNCEAKSLDGTASFEFLDFHGCPKESPVVLKDMNVPRENGSLFESDVFNVFMFPGHDQVLFTCQIQICFTGMDIRCSNRCSNSKSFPMEFDRLTSRQTAPGSPYEQRRREVAYGISQRKSVGTVLTVKH